MSSARSAELIEPLRAFIEERHLDGRATLADDTPLLEWGILDSFSLVDLVAFVEERFGLVVPIDAFTAENFRDLRAIATLLAGLDRSRA